MIKILIADDHKITVDGLTAFLEHEDNFDIVGQALNGEEVIDILHNTPVDIAILDIEMPGMDGIETTKMIKQRFPNTKVLILSMYKRRDFILNLFNLGVNGYLLKNRGSEELVSAINTIYKGGPYFPLEIMKTITEPASSQPVETPNLTDRELEILCLVAEAHTAKKIGTLLHIEKVTVETHIRNIKGKLGLNRNGELIRYAFQNKLCE